MRHAGTISRGIICMLALAPAACTGSTMASPSPSVSASARPSTPTVSPSLATAPDAWLLVGRAGDTNLQVIQARTDEHIFELPAGVPADEKWGELITATATGDKTTVRTVDVQPGYGGTEKVVEGSWHFPTIGYDPTPVGVSVDGSTIVLAADKGAATGSTTRFLVLDRSVLVLNSPHPVPPTTIELRGSFEFDALSPDGKVLYLVEHLATGPNGHYQVRAVDLPAGTLRPEVIVDKSKIDEAMAGWPISQLRTTDGLVFTLYWGDEHPFVHALNAAAGFAVCLDLPTGDRGLEEQRVLDWGLAASPDGTSVYAVNATVGEIVEIDRGALQIRTSASIEPIAQDRFVLAKFGHIEGGPVGRRVIVSTDGRMAYAAGAEGIVAIRTADLLGAGRYPTNSTVEAIGLTPDGSTIFALLGDGGRIVALDAATGKVIGAVAGKGYDRLLAIMPW
jgi:hypothetical protein